MALAFTLLLSSCAWLDAKQRAVVYRPTQGIPAGFAGLQAQDKRFFLSLPNAEKIELWWLPHENENAKAVMYYHGTFRNLYQNIDKINALRRAGFAVLAVDYRGWGQSSPITPSEQTIMQDADLAWQEFTRKVPNPSQRYLYGHSMGSGVAVDRASRLTAPHDYAGLILESAFTSFPDVAREAAPTLGPFLAALSHEQFDSIAKIKRIDAPLLMIHGSEDHTVPQVLGEQLFAAANAPKIWLSVKGAGHSDAELVGAQEYQRALRQFQK